MQYSALFFLASFFNLVYSSIRSPLFDEAGSSIMYEPEAILDRTSIESNIKAVEFMVKCMDLTGSPQEYTEFIEWLFGQPSFTFQDFDHMVEMKLVPLEIAHVAFSRFVEAEDDDVVENFGNTLKKYFNSFDGFQEEFVHIVQKIIEQELYDSSYVTAILELVEELQGDFKYLVMNEEFIRLLLDEEMTPLLPLWYAYGSMIESKWCSPADAGTLLSEFEFDIDPSLFENAKSKLVDLESATEFVHACRDIIKSLTPMIQWIVAQPWVTSQLIADIILNCDRNDENTLEFELIMHEKATFACLMNIRLEKFKTTHPMMKNFFRRIITLIKKEEVTSKQFNKYVASLTWPTGNGPFTTRSMVLFLLNTFPGHFYPASKFFPQFSNAYDHLDDNGSRKAAFALVYLQVFGYEKGKMDENDLDYVLDFAFASRPLWMHGEVKDLWVTVAEKVLRLSLRTGQGLIHAAKRNDNTVFSNVLEVTNLISTLSAQCLDKSINEIMQAHTLGDLFIPKIAGLGKYEKAFLMLTAPTISKLYFYTFKSIDPDCAFYKSAMRLNCVYNEQIRKQSYQIAKHYHGICNAYRSNKMDSFNDFPQLINLIKCCYIAEEHAGDLWMIQDMAEMILGYPERTNLRLWPEDFELLRKILALRAEKTKRILPADPNDEPPTKKARHI